MQNKEQTIRVSEIFHSIQGEGNTMGKPAVFLRLTGCNLLCGNPQGSLKGKTQEEINEVQGKNAEWTCDSIAVWLTGKKWFMQDLIDYLVMEYEINFMAGSMLVITGGEPMSQQQVLPDLIEGLRDALDKRIRVEIETNGTIAPSTNLTDEWRIGLVDQFNVSPKLSNSGMPKERRIIEDAISSLATGSQFDKVIFKFVITNFADIQEMHDDYVDPYLIPSKKIWLMPGCSNREQFEAAAPYVAQFCKTLGYQFSSRLQINLWNQVTGV